MSKIIDEKIVASAKIPTAIKEDPIIALTERVQALYLFRDHYFVNQPIENAINKNNDVEREMRNTLNKFDEYKGYEIDGDRAKYYYLKGRTLNVVDRYMVQAEELLSKAVKLEPMLIEAWNELGECYWKNDDIYQAKNCFVGALLHGRNKISLRNLSITLRQEPASTQEQKTKNIEEGLAYAKEAVNLDPSDGISWAILGNAHLSSFFTVVQNPKVLRQCISAYLQAEKDIVARSNPDLFYNKAVALKYEEEYKFVCESFQQAILLDPTWETPRKKYEQFLQYLKDLQDSINTKGKLKAKKLHQMLHRLNMKHLGPYKSESYVPGTSVKLDLVPLDHLIPGINAKKVVFGKVVCWIQTSDCVPLGSLLCIVNSFSTFCLVDSEKTCIGVTVYNLAEGQGVTIGDSVAIPEPHVIHHHFSVSGMNFDFKSLRVATPLLLVVNGKKLGRDQQAYPQLLTFTKTD